jgi:hypothetical protein
MILAMSLAANIALAIALHCQRRATANMLAMRNGALELVRCAQREGTRA